MDRSDGACTIVMLLVVDVDVSGGICWAVYFLLAVDGDSSIVRRSLFGLVAGEGAETIRDDLAMSGETATAIDFMAFGGEVCLAWAMILVGAADVEADELGNVAADSGGELIMSAVAEAMVASGSDSAVGTCETSGPFVT